MFDPRLITTLRRFADRAEAEAYLDLVGDVLAALGITDDDRRFHFNPTTQTTYVLPLTINNRYIVRKGRNIGDEASWWVIQPHGGVGAGDEEGGRLNTLAFAHKRHDPPAGAPWLIQYRAGFVREHLAVLWPPVLEIARRELAACRGTTPCRLAHSSAAYALALDDAGRAAVLGGVAFGTGSRRQPARAARSAAR